MPHSWETGRHTGFMSGSSQLQHPLYFWQWHHGSDNLCPHDAMPRGKNGKRRLKWLLFVCIGVTWSPPKMKQHYRRRFGIETSYRLTRRWRIHSTSSNPALRFFLYGLTFWIVNLWTLFKWKFVHHPGTRKIDPIILPLPRFAALLRQAIETLRGFQDTIPVFLDPFVLKLWSTEFEK